MAEGLIWLWGDAKGDDGVDAARFEGDGDDEDAKSRTTKIDAGPPSVIGVWSSVCTFVATKDAFGFGQSTSPT